MTDVCDCCAGRNKEGCAEAGSGDYGDCEDTTYGCCADGVTAASGPNQRGCPATTTTPTTTPSTTTVASGIYLLSFFLCGLCLDWSIY